MPLTMASLAVNMRNAGSPFSETVIARMLRAGIPRGEFPLNARYLDYAQPGVARQAGRQLRDAGIEVWSCHIPYGAEWDLSQMDDSGRRHAVELAAATFPAARELGATLIVLHPSWEPIADDERAGRLRQAQVSLHELADAAEPKGLRLAVELLLRTCLGHTAAELLTLIEPLDPALVGACLDTNHANLREDLSHAVHTLGNRLLTMHLSDNDGIDEKHLLPGQGVIAWPAFMQAVSASDYQGACVYENGWPSGDELNGLLAVRANFAALLEQAHGGI